MVGALRRLWIPAPEADSAVASLKRSRTCVTGEGGVVSFYTSCGSGGVHSKSLANLWLSGSRQGKKRGARRGTSV